MRRALAAVMLVGLALAGSAAAGTPPMPTITDTAVGHKAPIHVVASVSPPVQLFGTEVTASVTVVADTKWVDPTRLSPHVGFSPYTPIAPPVKHESGTGRVISIVWTWRLRCLTATCVPAGPPTGAGQGFHFELARIDYLRPNGKVEWATRTHFPRLVVFSGITPAIVSYLITTHRLQWQYELAPPAAAYRVSPALVFWLALVLAGICAAAAIALMARWILRFRSPVAVAAGPASSSLERALALFFWAGRRGDETLQRKALERVAAELPLDIADLSDATRELAWSPAIPEEDEVEAISERAGVAAHPENGTGE